MQAKQQITYHCLGSVAYHDARRGHKRKALTLMSWNDLEIRHRGKFRYSVSEDGCAADDKRDWSKTVIVVDQDKPARYGFAGCSVENCRPGRIPYGGLSPAMFSVTHLLSQLFRYLLLPLLFLLQLKIPLPPFQTPHRGRGHARHRRPGAEVQARARASLLLVKQRQQSSRSPCPIQDRRGGEGPLRRRVRTNERITCFLVMLPTALWEGKG